MSTPPGTPPLCRPLGSSDGHGWPVLGGSRAPAPPPPASPTSAAGRGLRHAERARESQKPGGLRRWPRQSVISMRRSAFLFECGCIRRGPPPPLVLNNNSPPAGRCFSRLCGSAVTLPNARGMGRGLGSGSPPGVSQSGASDLALGKVPGHGLKHGRPIRAVSTRGGRGVRWRKEVGSRPPGGGTEPSPAPGTQGLARSVPLRGGDAGGHRAGPLRG